MISKLPSRRPVVRFNARWTALAQSPPERVEQFLKEAGFESLEEALTALLADMDATAQSLRATGEIEMAGELEQLSAQILATLRGDA